MHVLFHSNLGKESWFGSMKLQKAGQHECVQMQALPAWFEASRHSCFLYVASELVKSFGGSGDEAQLQQLGAHTRDAAASHTPCMHARHILNLLILKGNKAPSPCHLHTYLSASGS